MKRRNELYHVVLPSNVRNPLVWDLFWTRILVHYRITPSGFYCSFDHLRFHNRDELYAYDADTLQHFGLKRVLFGGNGLSGLPYFYRHRGFDAVALDISSVVTKASRSIPPDEMDWIHFFGRQSLTPLTHQESKDMRERAAEAIPLEKMPGGSLEFVTADLFQWDPGNETFDAIILQQVVDCCPKTSDRAELARHLCQWLRPGGIVIIESRDHMILSPNPQTQLTLEACFEDAGFRIHLKEYMIWLSEWWKAAQNNSRLDPYDSGITEEEQDMRMSKYLEEAQQRMKANALEDFQSIEAGQRLAIFHTGTAATDPIPVTPQDLA